MILWLGHTLYVIVHYLLNVGVVICVGYFHSFVSPSHISLTMSISDNCIIYYTQINCMYLCTWWCYINNQTFVNEAIYQSNVVDNFWIYNAVDFNYANIFHV